MKVYSLTYTSYYSDEDTLDCENNIFTDYLQFKKAYEDNVTDISHNIWDKEERQEFLDKYLNKICEDVYWGSFTCDQMYRLVTKTVEIN
jgi:hypothetical protein